MLCGLSMLQCCISTLLVAIRPESSSSPSLRTAKLREMGFAAFIRWQLTVQEQQAQPTAHEKDREKLVRLSAPFLRFPQLRIPLPNFTGMIHRFLQEAIRHFCLLSEMLQELCLQL